MEIIRPESEFAEHKKLDALLSQICVPCLALNYQVKIRDRHGKLRVLIDSPSHSMTRNMLNKMFMIACCKNYGTSYADGSLYWKNTAGATTPYWHVSKQAVEGISIYGCGAPDGNSDKGIFIGTGTTAETIDDYAPEALIAEGTGAGQMEYGDNVTTKGWVSLSSYHYIQHSRAMANNSGGGITVGEIGIRFFTYPDFVSNQYILLARDAIASPQLVNDGEDIEVVYEFRLTFP